MRSSILELLKAEMIKFNYDGMVLEYQDAYPKVNGISCSQPAVRINLISSLLTARLRAHRLWLLEEPRNDSS